MFRRRRERVARREAATIDEMVQQIAQDKGRARFRPTEPGIERPREVFLAAVDSIAEPLVAQGFRYARSGPHLTRRTNHVTSKVLLGSSTLNVPGELVSLHVTLQAHDAELGKWRRTQAAPRRSDDLVATRHLGHLLTPGKWLEWNLASPYDRLATTKDISATLSDPGLKFLDSLAADLGGGADAGILAGRVDNESLIEFYVRDGRSAETPPLIEAMLARFHERGRAHFVSQIREFRRDGLPKHQLLGEPNGLAYLVVQFDLPVEVD